MTPLSQNSVEDARRQLVNCVLFRGLVTDERDAVVGRARMRHFAAGETIFLMASPGGSMMAEGEGVWYCSVLSLERSRVGAVVQQAHQAILRFLMALNRRPPRRREGW